MDGPGVEFFCYLNFRYWAVTNVDYIHNRNGKRIGTMIFLVWAVALALALAPLFGWKDAKFLERVNIEQRCMISQDVAYQIFATCATFYVPLTVILIVYWKIFQTARRRIRKNRRNQAAAAAAAVDGQADASIPAKANRVQKWFRLGKATKSPTLIDKPSIGQVDDGCVKFQHPTHPHLFRRQTSDCRLRLNRMLQIGVNCT